MADYIFLLETRLSQDQQGLIETLQKVTRAAVVNLYLTGGPMRDLLAGKPVGYLDFTTEGNPATLAAALQAAGAERMSPQPAQRSLHFSLRGLRARLMAAQGAAKSGGTIIEDLRARGLTLNSIGLSLNAGSRGLLLDPVNGSADIEARLVRMNHPYVFLEDPVMLLRAVRLQTRLEFGLDERTYTRMESAREGNYLQNATPAALGLELEALAYEPDPGSVLQALERDGWLEAAFGAGMKTAKMNLGALGQLATVATEWEQIGLSVDTGLAALPFLLGGLAGGEQARLGKMLMSRHLTDEWKSISPAAANLLKKIAGRAAPGLAAIGQLVEKTAPEALVYATLAPSDAKVGKKLKEFLVSALELRQRLPLGILRASNVAPQSLEGEKVLGPIFRRLLAGEALSDAAIAEIIRSQIAPPPPPPPAPPAPRGRGYGRPKGNPQFSNPKPGVPVGPAVPTAAVKIILAAPPPPVVKPVAKAVAATPPKMSGKKAVAPSPAHPPKPKSNGPAGRAAVKTRPKPAVHKKAAAPARARKTPKPGGRATDGKAKKKKK